MLPKDVGSSESVPVGSGIGDENDLNLFDFFALDLVWLGFGCVALCVSSLICSIL